MGESETNDNLLWWASEYSFNRAIDDAIELGYLPPDYSRFKEEAALYKGLPGARDEPDLLDAINRIANSTPRRLQSETDEYYDHYVKQLSEYRPIYAEYRRIWRK
ncbi:hypothetical protein [Gordonia effusa]|nr:hypothetical protein [Gordonia effusa]